MRRRLLLCRGVQVQLDPVLGTGWLSDLCPKDYLCTAHLRHNVSEAYQAHSHSEDVLQEGISAWRRNLGESLLKGGAWHTAATMQESLMGPGLAAVSRVR